MNDATKHLINQLLLALGAAAAVFGLGKLTGITDYLLTNLDTVWAALLTLVGVIAGLVGFFKGKSQVSGVQTADADQTKHVVYQVLVALGMVATLLGLAKVTGIATYLLENLDAVWAAVTTLVGVVVGLIGYFKGQSQFTAATLKN